jgi:hypothetical protein
MMWGDQQERFEIEWKLWLENLAHRTTIHRCRREGSHFEQAIPSNPNHSSLSLQIPPLIHGSSICAHCALLLLLFLTVSFTLLCRGRNNLVSRCLNHFGKVWVVARFGL